MCTGMDTLEPNYRIEDDRLVWSLQLNKNPYTMGMFCESKDYLMYNDPRQELSEEKLKIF